MSGIYLASPFGAMIDPSKGSLTNRGQCAKEHLKNNLGYYSSIGLAGAAGTYAAIKKPKILVKSATKIGNLTAKLLNKLGGKNMAANIMKNPTKFGKYSLLLAGAVWALTRLENFIYKKGQIDQKYTDSAAIESQTKNIILDGPRKKCTPEEIKEFYRNGGRGVC